MPELQDSKTKVAGAHAEASLPLNTHTLQAYKHHIWNMPQTHEILKGGETECLDVNTQKTPRVVENRDISSLHPNTEVLNALALAFSPK